MSWDKLPREIRLLIFSELARSYLADNKVAFEHRSEEDRIKEDPCGEDASKGDASEEETSEEDASEDDRSEDNLAWEERLKCLKEIVNYLLVCKSWKRDFPEVLPEGETICTLFLGGVEHLALESMEEFYWQRIGEDTDHWINDTLVFVTKKSLVLCMELLLKEGGDVNHLSGQYKRSLISYAVEEGSIDGTKVLLAQKPDLEVTGSNYGWYDPRQNTPLGIAIIYDRLEIADLLLKAGADAGIILDHCYGPDDVLQFLAREGETAMLKLLLDHGANPDSIWDTWSALEPDEDAESDGYARAEGWPTGGSHSQHPLQLAVMGGHVGCVRVFLEDGFILRDMEETVSAAKSSEMRELLKSYC
ncbi:ankyrin repeat-containing domain protein [Aspergillus spectabilis]